MIVVALLFVILVLCPSVITLQNGSFSSSFTKVAGQFVEIFSAPSAVADVVWVSELSGLGATDADADEIMRFLVEHPVDRTNEFSFLFINVGEVLDAGSKRYSFNETLTMAEHSHSYQNPVLFVVPNTADFLVMLPKLSPAILASSVWLVFAEKDLVEMLTEQISSKLRLDSQIYVYLESDLFEWYRTGPTKSIVQRTVAVNDHQGVLKLIVPSYIWDRRGDLDGLSFKTAYVEQEPFVYKDGEKGGQMRGIMYDMARTLAQTLNFSMQFLVQDLYGERLENGSWLGVVGLLQRHEADLTISDFSITHSRSEVIDFALGIYMQNAQLFMHLPEQALSWTTFIGVFNPQFWLTLAFVVLLSSVTFHFIFACSVGNKEHRSLLQSFSSVLLSLGALSVSESPRTVPARSIFLAVCLFGAIIYWSYNAILVSLLTVDTHVLPINGFDDLLAGANDYQLILKEGTAYTQFFSDASPKDNKVAWAIYNKMVRNNPAAFAPTVASAGEMVVGNSKLVFFGDKDSARLTMRGYPCSISSAPAHYYENSVTFAFPKHSEYVALFSAKILSLRQAGEVNKVLRRYLSAKSTITCADRSFTEIGYENIFTAFVVLVTGSVVAATIAVAEAVKKFSRGYH